MGWGCDGVLFNTAMIHALGDSGIDYTMMTMLSSI